MRGVPHYGKAIRHARLLDILATLPIDALLAPNAVGNLAITNMQGDYLGYIDIAEDETHVFAEARP